MHIQRSLRLMALSAFALAAGAGSAAATEPVVHALAGEGATNTSVATIAIVVLLSVGLVAFGQARAARSVVRTGR